MKIEVLTETNVQKRCLELVMSLFSDSLRDEIMRICSLRRDFPDGLSEIRIRKQGRSSLVISGENLPLSQKISENDFRELVERVTDGSIFAHVDNINEGFIAMDGGVRVGVCTSYCKEIYSMCFRLPVGTFRGAEELYSLLLRGRAGMLIYSLPQGGKTTALRALAGYIGQKAKKRAVVVDERCEFDLCDYENGTVDILRGIPKAKGIEIAKRTLSAEIILVDEIGSAEECEALLSVGAGGVPIIATAHSDDFSELCRSENIRPLIDRGYFSSFVRLYRSGKAFCKEVREL